MFTGIVEAMGRVTGTEQDAGNLHLRLNCPFTHELRVDQSLSHNGVCLTVTAVSDQEYSVTAVGETLSRTNIGSLRAGDLVNLERCLPATGRFDGHIVQGHVDTTGTLLSVEDLAGSYKLHFSHDPTAGITVAKGSICVNGISLTVVDSEADGFSVVIIPYTWENTNLSSLKPGDPVNLEFDILGKYMQKLMNVR